MGSIRNFRLRLHSGNGHVVVGKGVQSLADFGIPDVLLQLLSGDVPSVAEPVDDGAIVRVDKVLLIENQSKHDSASAVGKSCVAAQRD